MIVFDLAFNVQIYATLLLATALNVFIRQAIFRMASLRASRALHDGSQIICPLALHKVATC